MRPFFLDTAGILVTGPQRHGGIGVYTSPGPITVSKEEERAGRLSLEVTVPSIFTDVSGRIANDQLSGATPETYIGLPGASLELHSVRRARASLDSSEL